jgi:hypothetical protein
MVHSCVAVHQSCAGSDESTVNLQFFIVEQSLKEKRDGWFNQSGATVFLYISFAEDLTEPIKPYFLN